MHVVVGVRRVLPDNVEFLQAPSGHPAGGIQEVIRLDSPDDFKLPEFETAIFPEDIENYLSGLGESVKVSRQPMTEGLSGGGETFKVRVGVTK